MLKHKLKKLLCSLIKSMPLGALTLTLLAVAALCPGGTALAERGMSPPPKVAVNEGQKKPKPTWVLEGTRDFGLSDSANPWTRVGGEAALYLNLGDYSWSRHNVLALQFWSQYSPTMKVYTQGGDSYFSDAPPHYMRPNLGGFWRLRGYNSYRFNDKAAILYTAEWRVIPKWQPLPKISWLNFFQIDWWQFVALGELGRVAPDYDLGELHRDMKWDAGPGLRLMVMKAVCRLDVAMGEEGLGVYAMVGHPFKKPGQSKSIPRGFCL